MGETEDDTHMVTSDEEDSSARRARSVSNRNFPFETLIEGLQGVITMLSRLPDTVAEELSQHRVSARYKEKHGETLKRELMEAREAHEHLLTKCSLTETLCSNVVQHLNRKSIGSTEDWEQYVQTVECGEEILSQLSTILNVEALQVVKAVKEMKHRVETEVYPTTAKRDGLKGTANDELNTTTMNPQFQMPVASMETGACSEPK
ncbi:hypothetical protein Q1695_014952 [Nippostrongylus brasiliensis]|nr:hypothetical protein Q1695_014952 [Nippostrongylus brasiliensis]